MHTLVPPCTLLRTFCTVLLFSGYLLLLFLLLLFLLLLFLLLLFLLLLFLLFEEDDESE